MGGRLVHRGFNRRQVLAGVGGLLAAPAVVRAQGQRAGAALVIGNSRYQWEAPLPNVRRDAPDIAKRFQAMGLQTELLQDAGREAMRQGIEKFKSMASGANLAAFYFGGHGVTAENSTLLVPADADLSNPSSMQSLIPTASVGAAMQAASHRLVVFDNCRNNPSDGWRQLQAVRSAAFDPGRQRSAELALGANTLVLYSTAPGRVALDGPAGENSPFAATLLRHLDGGSIDLQALPARLRRDLLVTTRGRQVLWDENSYQQPFVLGGARAAGARPGADPAGVIELPNAYAFVRENNLPLPAGLIAFRSVANSPDAQKIGAFKFEGRSSSGRDSRLLLVVSVDEQRTAEVVVAGAGGKGAYWRFVTATCSARQLDLLSRDFGDAYTFEWSDANSGTVTQVRDKGGLKRGGVIGSRFTRLDG